MPGFIAREACGRAAGVAPRRGAASLSARAAFSGHATGAAIGGRARATAIAAADSVPGPSGISDAAGSSRGSVAAGSRGKVLVLPAYLSDASAFLPFVRKLRAMGYDAAMPSIRWYNWLPTVGGRSMRPICDRIDYALATFIDGGGGGGAQASEATGFEVPLPPGRVERWLDEMMDASKGAQPPLPAAGPVPAPLPPAARAAVVASSAAGWIARIVLGGGPSPEYGGRVYHGAGRVHTLITLGAPHVSAEPVTRKNIDAVNRAFPGALHFPDVRCGRRPPTAEASAGSPHRRRRRRELTPRPTTCRPPSHCSHAGTSPSRPSRCGERSTSASFRTSRTNRTPFAAAGATWMVTASHHSSALWRWTARTRCF